MPAKTKSSPKPAAKPTKPVLAAKPAPRNVVKRSAAPALTLDGERNALLDLLTQGEDNHWQMGVHYNNIVDQNLATGAGYPTAADYFAKQLKQVPQSTLTLYGSVAKAFPEDIAKKYGVTKLGLLLTYQTAAHAPPASGDPGSVMVGVVQKDGSVVQTPFASCSTGDLTGAIKHLRTPPALPGTADADIAKVQAALDTALGQGKVHVTGHLRGHNVVIQLSAFDLALRSTVADALKS